MSFTDFPFDITVLLLKVTVWCCCPFLLWSLLRRCSAAQRHLVLALTLAGVLVLPLLTLWVPSFDGPNLLPPKTNSSARAVLSSTARPTLAKATVATSGAAKHRDRVVPTKSLEVGTEPGSAVRSSPEGRGSVRWDAPLGTIILVSWVVVSALLLVRLGRKFGALHTLYRTSREILESRPQSVLECACRQVGYRKRPGLRESERISIPLASTFGNEFVLLPVDRGSWSETRLRRVLLHEVAHLHRRDGWTTLVGHLATVVFWFHPLVWGLHFWARREAERAADNTVLLAGEAPSAYAKELLTLAQGFHPYESPEVSLAMLNPSNLKSRLVAILDSNQRRSPVRRVAIALLAVVSVVLVASFAGVQLSTPSQAEVDRSFEPSFFGGASLVFGGLDSALPSTPGGRKAPTRQTESQRRQQKKRLGEKAGHQAYKSSDEGYQQGQEFYEDNRFAEAAQAYRGSAEAGYRPTASYYNGACSASLAGNTDLALELLRRSLDSGWDDPRHLAHDSDFDPIRSDNRFQKLVDENFLESDKHRRPLKDYRLRSTVENFEVLRENSSSDGDAWYEVGSDLLSLRLLDDAEYALTQAARTSGEDSDSALYNLACTYSLAGDISQAASTLRQAVETGFSNPQHMRQDPDLANLRGSPAFQPIAELADALDLDRFRQRRWRENHKKEKNDNLEYSPEMWAPAVEYYSDWVARQPESGRGWNNLAWSQHHSRQFADAIISFKKAHDLGYRPGTSAYNIACGYAMLGESDQALNWLKRALASGYDGIHHAENDSDLANLRDEPEFRRLLLEAKVKS